MRPALRNRTLGIVVLSTTPGAIAYGLAVWVSLPDGAGMPRWVGLISGIVLTAMSVGVPLWRRARELSDLQDEVDKARNEVQRGYKDVLSPLSQQLGQLVAAGTAAEYATVRGKLLMSVLQAAVTLTGGERHRACWYELATAANQARSLMFRERSGRADPVSACFEEDGAEGKEIFSALDKGEGRLYDNLEGERLPEGWVANSRRSYRGFISVPVRLGGRIFGMLTVDSPRPCNLRGGHVALMHLLADLFAAALAVPVPCESKREPVRRESCPFVGVDHSVFPVTDDTLSVMP